MNSFSSVGSLSVDKENYLMELIKKTLWGYVSGVKQFKLAFRCPNKSKFWKRLDYDLVMYF